MALQAPIDERTGRETEVEEEKRRTFEKLTRTKCLAALITLRLTESSMRSYSRSKASSRCSSPNMLSEGCDEVPRPPPTERPRRCKLEELAERPLPRMFSEDILLASLGVPPSSEYTSGGIAWAMEGLEAFGIESRAWKERPVSPMRLWAKMTEEYVELEKERRALSREVDGSRFAHASVGLRGRGS